MNDTFVIGKYKGKWSILDVKTCVWYDANGKQDAIRKAQELNKMMKNRKDVKR